MGGKVWTIDEERYFWKTAIPLSAKRKGIHLSNPEYKWGDLAAKMQRELGDKAQRTYTALMLFEHFFQNTRTPPRLSPNAGRFVRAYLGTAVKKQKATKMAKNRQLSAKRDSHHPQGTAQHTTAAKEHSSQPAKSVAQACPIHAILQPDERASENVVSSNSSAASFEPMDVTESTNTPPSTDGAMFVDGN